jgi:hypothetical protein
MLACAFVHCRNVVAGAELLLKQKPGRSRSSGLRPADAGITSSFEFCKNGANAVSWEASCRGMCDTAQTGSVGPVKSELFDGFSIAGAVIRAGGPVW